MVILSIIFFLVIVSIISLFIPSHVRISRVVQINHSKEMVMSRINDPVEWKNWYPGADSAKLFYENGIAKGIILNERKHQNLIITSKKDHEVMAIYTMPNRKVSTGWQIAPAIGSNSVTVQWYMDFHLHWYPWEKFSSFMFEKVYGPQMEAGLKNLKAELEK
ncbi:MAG TPA: SRPBCC family protein [Chitinophagaceae bacterium]|nr:SRPBCC family protein [Chitinophagaceae bacterium]